MKGNNYNKLEAEVGNDYKNHNKEIIEIHFKHVSFFSCNRQLLILIVVVLMDLLVQVLLHLSSLLQLL